ncbi:MAG: pseudouridine synthase [Oscillospiraceae bacterium]|nr:pseudouridine synthase [Oscillospiraceae bacterium]
MAEERLQKYMAECGIASRRKSEELIRAGKVMVNGEPAEIGRKIDPNRDVVTVDGRKVRHEQKHVYLMLNKPRGFISTMSDEYDRRCVAELVADVGTRVYPVGRLDRDSEGLLLFTNDGKLANQLMHPSRHVPKTYRVTVRPEVTDDMITTMMTGMMLDGKQTLPADVKVLVKEPDRTVLEVTICEGRNRQIRRMCEQLGLEVARLKRISEGPVKLGMLKLGTWRELTPEEVRALKQSAGRE